LKSFNGLKAGVSVADTATRPAGLGTNSKVQVGSKQQRGRFSPEAKATLDPSVTAIEVALLLGRPDNFLARMRKACRKPVFEKTEAYLAARKSLDDDKSISPSRKEDLKKTLREKALAAQLHDWRVARLEATLWVRLVRRYEVSRDYIKSLDPRVQAAFIKLFEHELHQANRNLVPSASKEQERGRVKYRNELRRHDRMRRQFGWRGTSDGRTTRLPIDAEGDVDPVQVAKTEAEKLFASQTIDGRNQGFEVFRDPWLGIFDDADGLVLAQRLARAVKEFRAKKGKG
jgi:hypothetical protein